MAPAKKVTQYSYSVTEPTEPETGHTKLLPSDEKNHTIDMDPLYDPELHWAGKARNKIVPILPLQRNEIIGESKIAQIIERTSKAAKEGSSQAPLTSFFELEKALREKDRPQRVEFYRHEEQWKNKLICGDSLLIIESLLHYEGLPGRVQMIYIDPPYGIKYDSNFQQRVDVSKNDEKDRADDVLTIKAFNDTWALGVHSYLSYLQERLYLCRELLAKSGSIFVQISDENQHYVRSIMDEVFGRSNFVAQIPFIKMGIPTGKLLGGNCDYLLWYSRDKSSIKYRQLILDKQIGQRGAEQYVYVALSDGGMRRLRSEEIAHPSSLPVGSRLFRPSPLISEGRSEQGSKPFRFQGVDYDPGPKHHWKTTQQGLARLVEAKRIMVVGKMPYYIRYLDDFHGFPLSNVWTDTASSGFAAPKLYAVQTNTKVVERCILMTTDPGDLVLDPTCGSGTTAYCAERWGRRWITCDTSRVAINVARKRLLSAVFKHYRTRNGGVSSGFVYRNIPRVTLKSVAYGKEPEKVELVDNPEVDDGAVRVTGPFELLTVGRYSIDDWKGYVRQGEKLENYINVICRLYRKDAAVQGASGLIHAIAESEGHKIALSVGPLSGRVTAKQISDAVEDAIASGIYEIHVLGWAFEANVGEIISRIESRGKIKVNPVMIRPDTLAEGLKAASPETLFSPYALPDIEIRGDKEATIVALSGVAVFDRKTRATDYKSASSGYISAWYLDEDYDGDCFVDCQMFFNSPDLKLDKLVEAKVPKEELKLQVESRPFKVRGYRRIAVKVIDVFGNESTVVRELSQ
jgi:adenine-specific DNA-methyltransferase